MSNMTASVASNRREIVLQFCQGSNRELLFALGAGATDRRGEGGASLHTNLALRDTRPDKCQTAKAPAYRACPNNGNTSNDTSSNTTNKHHQQTLKGVGGGYPIHAYLFAVAPVHVGEQHQPAGSDAHEHGPRSVHERPPLRQGLGWEDLARQVYSRRSPWQTVRLGRK